MNTENTEIRTAATDSFSWKRVGMVAAYHYPNLKLQIMLYPTVSLVIGFLCSWMFHYNALIPIASIIASLLSLMVYLGPMVFLIRSNRIAETMLPAKASEKALFVISYCIIAIPAMVQGFDWLGEAISKAVFGTPELIYEALNMDIVKENLGWGRFFTVVQLIFPASVCMYFVVALRHRRWLSGIYAFLSTMALGIVVGAYGIYRGIMAAIHEESAALLDSNNPDPEEVLTVVFGDYHLFFGICLLVCAGIIVLMSVLTARKIRNIQI